MLRRLFSSEQIHNGQIMFEGKPYDGIAFEQVSDGSMKSYIVENGIIIGNYIPIVSKGENFDNQFDIESDRIEMVSDETWYHYNLNGEPYEGVLYYFDRNKNICDAESFCINGWERWESNFRFNGDMVEFNAPNRYFSEYYKWFENGDIKNCCVRSINSSPVRSMCCTIQYDEYHNIISIVFDNYINNVDVVNLFSKIYIPEKEEQLYDSKAGEKIFIRGNDIDDNFLINIFGNGGGELTKKCEIRGTSINDFSILEKIFPNAEIKILT